jgi:hypothetical protein
VSKVTRIKENLDISRLWSLDTEIIRDHTIYICGIPISLFTSWIPVRCHDNYFLDIFLYIFNNTMLWLTLVVFLER